MQLLPWLHLLPASGRQQQFLPRHTIIAAQLGFKPSTCSWLKIPACNEFLKSEVIENCRRLNEKINLLLYLADSFPVSLGSKRCTAYKSLFATLLWVVASHYCFISPFCFCVFPSGQHTGPRGCCGEKQHSQEHPACKNCEHCIKAVPSDNTQLTPTAQVVDLSVPLLVSFAHIAEIPYSTESAAICARPDRFKVPPDLLFIKQSRPNAPPISIA